MPPCEFKERQYEFCANDQLHGALGAYLVGGLPTIPSQVEEALKGYDAAYKFSGGRTLFIQYKVAHFSLRAHGRGASTFRLWSSPYYRASLHQDRYGHCTQHNTLIGMTSPSSESLYVSPCFVTNSDLQGRFATGSGTGVLDASVLAPLSGLPTIHGPGQHSITYPEDASAFRVHSRPSPAYPTFGSLGGMLERIEPEDWNEQFFAAVRNRLREGLLSQDVALPEPPEGTEFDGPLAEVAAILEQRLGAVMVLLPLKQSAPADG